MAEMIIRVSVPDEIDLHHALQSVSDALYLPENVTQKEYDLVCTLLSKLCYYDTELTENDLLNFKP